MKEFFAPGVGANFTVCRMPVAANDFSLNWYSYNETDGDFDMTKFSIDNDKNTLIPFIMNSQQYLPELEIWASPWSPPSWMKYNKHYASRSSVRMVHEKIEKMIQDQKNDPTKPRPTVSSLMNSMTNQYSNDLPADKEGKEGTNMFIQEEKYMKAYALYFSKFIDAYQNEGIKISKEYYLLKHVRHFVRPGAKKLDTGGEYKDLRAFLNPDQSIVVVVANQEQTEKSVNIKTSDKVYSPKLASNSFNTLLIN